MAVTQRKTEPETAGNDWFTGMAEDSYVQVSRLDDVTKKWVMLGRLSKFEVTEENVQEKAGGGSYRLIERRRDSDSGRMVYGKQITVEIGGPQIPKEEVRFNPPAKKEGNGTAAPNVAQPPSATSMMDSAMTAAVVNLLAGATSVQESQAKAFALIANRPQTDWATILTAAMPLITALVTQKKSDVNPLEIVKEVAALMKANTGPAIALKDQLGVLNELMDLKTGLNEDASQPKDAMSLATDALPRILDIIQTQQAQGKSPTAESVRAAMGQPGAPTPEGPQPVDPVALFLGKIKKPLLALASQGLEPESAADYVMKMLPAPLVNGPLKQFIGRPDAAEQLSTHIPELQHYADWTGDTFEILHRAFYPEQYDEEGQEVEVEPGAVVVQEYGPPSEGEYVEEDVEEIE